MSSPKIKEMVNKTDSFKWSIEGFSKLTEKKKYSEIFYMGGLAWRILIFPKGNNVDCLSIYLDAADSETKAEQEWSIDAKLSLTMISQFDDDVKVKKEFQHQFNASEEDWGFTSFMPLADLYDPHKGYLVKDTCIIEAIVAVQSVVPPKKSTKTPSDPSKNEGSSAQSEKSPANCHVVTEDTQGNPLPSLFHHFGLLKVRNPPYSLPNGYRITEGAGLDDGDMASRLIQSSLISSELQSLVEMPVVDLEKQGYYHLAKFLHYHCASIVSAQGVQSKHQEHANALEELQLSLENSAKEVSQLRGDLQKAAEEKAKVVEELAAAKQKTINLEGEAKQKTINLEGKLKLLYSENVDLQIQLEDALKAKENAANQAVDHNNGELAAAKEKIMNMEGELLLLFSKNVDLQIQLEDARKVEENVANQAVEDFKASIDHNDELRAMAINSLKQATELFCTRFKNKLPMFDPTMIDNLAKDTQASLANEVDGAA